LGNTDAVRLCLTHGADVDKAEQNGMTPFLRRGPEGSHCRDAAVRLDGGADVERLDHEGWSPLLVACQEGQVDAVLLRLQRGADTNRTVASGRNPQEIADLHEHVTMAAWLS